MDWEGKYPPTLEALYPDCMEVEDLFCTTDQNERKIPMIYRGGDLVEEGKRVSLLDWPIPFGDKKIVSYTGGHIVEERLEP